MYCNEAIFEIDIINTRQNQKEYKSNVQDLNARQDYQEPDRI